MESLFKITHEVRYADWPFIIQNFFFYLLFLIAGSYYIENSETVILYAIALSAFFLLITLFHIYRILKKEFGLLQYKTQAIQEIYQLLSIRAPIPSMNGWAATPELAIGVIKLIQTHKPKTIVELGSGVTTLITGYALERFHPQGKLISFDHDPEFAVKTRENLQLHQVTEWVDLRVVKLKNVTIRKEKWKWYDTDQLYFDEPIDLVIVDGPPVKTQKNARYPALPLLYDHLSPKAVVIIHDTKRLAEVAVIEKWLKEYPDFKETVEYSEKGITILHR